MPSTFGNQQSELLLQDRQIVQVVLQRHQSKVANGTVKLDQQVDVALVSSFVVREASRTAPGCAPRR